MHRNRDHISDVELRRKIRTQADSIQAKAEQALKLVKWAEDILDKGDIHLWGEEHRDSAGVAAALLVDAADAMRSIVAPLRPRG